MLTLIITDLDTLDATTNKSAQPAEGAGQITDNFTLKNWVPALSEVDTLMAADAPAKTLEAADDPLASVRVAYQMPLEVTVPGGKKCETAFPYTFEDALAFENLDFFKTLEGYGLVVKFREAIEGGGNAEAIGKAMYDALRNGKKAEFALDVILAEGFDRLTVPGYIAEGLEWLQERLEKKQAEILPMAETETI
jgi:hypothetical protein